MSNRLSVEQGLILDSIPRLGCATLQRLLDGRPPQYLFEADDAALAELGMSDKQRQSLRNPPMMRIERCLEWLEASEHYLYSFFDSDYPEPLKHIASPPLLLFAKGRPELMTRPQLAVVGSRHASWSGQKQAERFASELAQQGLSITSGLALGIDAAAHLGALNARSDGTIAVVATGLDLVYPKRHLKLAHRIAEQGLILSEFWPGVSAKAQHFPRRNRIISGLSLGVLVVEASLPSGSLLTANYAAEQGREVFAIPGSIDDPLRAGCHKLIQEGAKLVADPVDIVEELLDFSPIEEQVSTNPDLEDNKALPNAGLLDSVGYEVTPIDQVVAHSQRPVDEVLAQLVELEIRGVVAAVPGGYVRLRRN